MALIKIKDRGVLDTFFAGYVEKSNINSMIEVETLKTELKANRLVCATTLLKAKSRFATDKSKLKIDDTVNAELDELMSTDI